MLLSSKKIYQKRATCLDIYSFNSTFVGGYRHSSVLLPSSPPIRSVQSGFGEKGAYILVEIVGLSERFFSLFSGVHSSSLFPSTPHPIILCLFSFSTPFLPPLPPPCSYYLLPLFIKQKQKKKLCVFFSPGA